MKPLARASLSRGLALFAATSIALTGCDNFPHKDRIGATLAPDGDTIEIQYVLCDSQRVTEVRLEESSADGSGTDSTLWQISSEGGSTEERFPLGSTPNGFDEVVPFAGGVSANAKLVAVVETTSGVATVDFAPSDLDTSKVLPSLGEPIHSGAFREQALQTCHSGG